MESKIKEEMKTVFTSINEGLAGVDQLIDLLCEEIRTSNADFLADEKEDFDLKWQTILTGVRFFLDNAERLNVSRGHIGQLKNEFEVLDTVYSHISENTSSGNNAKKVNFMASMQILSDLIQKLDTVIGKVQERFDLEELRDAQEKRKAELKAEIMQLYREEDWRERDLTAGRVDLLKKTIDKKKEIQDKVLEENEELVDMVYIQLLEGRIKRLFNCDLVELIGRLNSNEIDAEDEQEVTQEICIDIPESVVETLERNEAEEETMDSAEEAESSLEEKELAERIRKFDTVTIEGQRFYRIQGEIRLSSELIAELEERYLMDIDNILSMYLGYSGLWRISKEKTCEFLIEEEVDSLEARGYSEVEKRTGKYGNFGECGRNVLTIHMLEGHIRDAQVLSLGTSIEQIKWLILKEIEAERNKSGDQTNGKIEQVIQTIIQKIEPFLGNAKQAIEILMQKIRRILKLKEKNNEQGTTNLEGKDPLLEEEVEIADLLYKENGIYFDIALGEGETPQLVRVKRNENGSIEFEAREEDELATTEELIDSREHSIEINSLKSGFKITRWIIETIMKQYIRGAANAGFEDEKIDRLSNYVSLEDAEGFFEEITADYTKTKNAIPAEMTRLQALHNAHVQSSRRCHQKETRPKRDDEELPKCIVTNPVTEIKHSRLPIREQRKRAERWKEERKESGDKRAFVLEGDELLRAWREAKAKESIDLEEGIEEMLQSIKDARRIYKKLIAPAAAKEAGSLLGKGDISELNKAKNQLENDETKKKIVEGAIAGTIARQEETEVQERD